jgi:hypothetical protein
MRIQIIGDPQQFITNLAIILRQQGTQELMRRVKQLNRHNLLHLLPNHENIGDDTLRLLLINRVTRRLEHLDSFQTDVQVFLDRLDLDELKEEAGNNSRVTLGHDDIPGYTYEGKPRTSRKLLRQLARDSFADDRRATAEESALWNKQVTARKRKENKK